MIDKMFYTLDLIRQYEDIQKLKSILEEWHKYSNKQSKIIVRLRAENRRLKKQIKELKSDFIS